MKAGVVDHEYAPNGQVINHLGEEACQHCPLPKANGKHVTPQITAEQQAHDAAVLGEHEEDEA